MAKTDLIEAKFNYNDIEDEDSREKLRYCAKEINRLKGVVAKGAMELGEKLAIAHEQRAKFGQGTFQRWVEQECGFSVRTAYNYMDAFNVFGNCATVAQIEDSAMYALAAEGTPEKARKEVLRLTENGVKVTKKQAKEIINKYKEEEPAVSEEAKEEEEEKEPEIEEEPTLEEICDADNKAIESFCRAIVKHFEKEVPRLPWTQDSGRIDSALAALKSGLTTLRGAKAQVCPACVEGQTEKGKCRYCKGHGYLPVYQANQIPEDSRL